MANFPNKQELISVFGESPVKITWENDVIILGPTDAAGFIEELYEAGEFFELESMGISRHLITHESIDDVKP